MSILDYFKNDVDKKTTIDYSNNDTIFNNIKYIY